MIKIKNIISLSFPFIIMAAFLGSVELIKYSDWGDRFKEIFASYATDYYDSSLYFFIIANLFYILIIFLGFLNARKQYTEQQTDINQRLTSLRSLKPISILIPCYNEEATVYDSLSSMLRLNFPEYEVIVCNDGSKDKTLDILINEFSLKEINTSFPKILPSNRIKKIYHSQKYKNLYVVDKENGGKADALNAALNLSQYPLVCCVDSDSIVDSSGLLNVALPFIEDEGVIATGGTILTANGEKSADKDSLTQVNTEIPFSWYGMIQAVEYLRAFLVGRLGWDYLKCDPIISGAFGLFKKSLVIQVGGYATNTIGEDMELILRMQSHCKQRHIPHAVKLLPIPVCWTEPPSDLKTLANQRIRWNQGLAESLWTHKNMFFRPWAGNLGFIGLPYFLFFELLAAPAEIISYFLAFTGYSLGIFPLEVIGILFALTVVFGFILNLAAIVIDQLTFNKYKNTKDILLLILGSMLEHFGFRQLHLYWRLKGIYRWIRGKQSWGEMKRKGLSKEKPASTPQDSSQKRSKAS